jgi:hypothetical protein
MVPQKKAQGGSRRYEAWSSRDSRSQIEVLLGIRDSLAELTEGCEVGRLAEGFYCLRHGRPIEEGSTRCDSFERRSSHAGEDPTKRQIEDYVRGVLGIKTGKNFRRLVDWWDGSRIRGGTRTDLENS